MNTEALPGEQYIPSNSTEGYAFIGSFCVHCAHDRSVREFDDLDECDDDQKCDVLARSFAGTAVEWRRMPDGRKTCTAYVPEGQPIPPAPCAHTLNLF